MLRCEVTYCDIPASQKAQTCLLGTGLRIRKV